MVDLTAAPFDLGGPFDPAVFDAAVFDVAILADYFGAASVAFGVPAIDAIGTVQAVDAGIAAVAFGRPGIDAIGGVPVAGPLAVAFGVQVDGRGKFIAPDLSAIAIVIGGVAATWRLGTLQITDVINEQPNAATLTLNGGREPHARAPVRGQDIKIYLGPIANHELLFGGEIVTVQQVYDAGRPENVAYHLTCTDYTRQLNRRTVTARYEKQSATTIVLDLMAKFTAGFTVAHVVAGLPVCGPFDFTFETMAGALTTVLTQIGGYWYPDYDKDLHAFLTEPADQPAPLTPTAKFRDLSFDTDLAQVRTRVLVAGQGSTTLAPVAPGETAIPVADASMFGEAGGQAVTDNQQRITYTSRALGGAQGTIAGSVTPPPVASPSANLGTLSGPLDGDYRYAVSFGTADGETAPGPTSNTVHGSPYAPPASAPTVNAAAGAPLGPLVGTYGYKLTFITSAGETLASSATTSRTAFALAAPVAPTLLAVFATLGPLIGAYGYKVTYLTASGETLGGAVGNITAIAATAPAAPGGAYANAGPLIGNYQYKVSFVSAIGETLGAQLTASPTVTPALTPGVAPGGSTGNKITYSICYYHPTLGESAMSNEVEVVSSGGATITISGLPAGCGAKIFSTGTYAGSRAGLPKFCVATLPIGVTTFLHTTQTGPQQDSTSSSMGQIVNLNTVAVGPTGTIGRRIYRTKAGGAAYFLVADIGDNTTTAWSDAVPDAALVTAAPGQNLNGQRVTVTIPTGPAGVVLARRIYRTKAGGAGYQLLAEIDDNTTTTYTDAMPDAALGASMPLVATAGGEQHDLGFVTGPTGTVARRIYRTKSGGSTFQLLAEIADNTTITYRDAIPDNALGAPIPIVNKAGASSVDLTSIPIGPAGVTSRILYRGKNGGDLLYLATITDNGTSNFHDAIPDESLGRPPLTTATAISGIPAGAAVIPLAALPLGFAAAPGWAQVADVLVRYSGITGTTLTGLPALIGVTGITRSGAIATATTAAAHGYKTGQYVNVGQAVQREYNGVVQITVTSPTTFTYAVSGAPATPATGTILTGPIGALTVNVAANAPVTSAAQLSGVPASGAGALTASLARGARIALLVQQDDVAAQTALAAIEGGDGVIEHFINDERLTLAAAAAVALADLTLFKNPEVRVQYTTRDPLHRSGKTIAINLPAPTVLVGSFLIQTVTITYVGTAKHANPVRAVQASSTRFSFDDVLRQLTIGDA